MDPPAVPFGHGLHARDLHGQFLPPPSAAVKLRRRTPTLMSME
jgi:hypothetical protein